MAYRNEGVPTPIYLTESSEETPADADPLLFEDEIPSAQSELSEIDSEVQAEFSDNDDIEIENEEPVGEVSDEPIQEHGVSLNRCYEEYAATPNDETLSRLLRDIENFARRVTSKVYQQFANPQLGRYFNQTITDTHPQTEISNAVTLRVWKNLAKFKRECKFSSWVYEISRNAVIDCMREISNRRDIDLKLLDWKDYEAPSASEVGTRNTSNRGTAPDGTGDLNNPDDNSGHGAAPVLSQEYIAANEAGLNTELDLEKVFGKLSQNDRHIIEMYKDGYLPAEIGTAFLRDAKWASNQLVRLKELLRHELYICETVLHTCRVSIKTTPVMQMGILYVENGDSYRAMQSCRCRKGLTGLEAKALLKNGEASCIYKVSEDGKPLLIHGEIWASQAIRTPRVGLSSSRAHIEKAYGIGQGGNKGVARNIELEHEISVNELRKLIVPFKPDPWEGRVIFTSFSEQGTPSKTGVTVNGEFQSDTWVAPVPKPIPTEHCSNRIAFRKVEPRISKSQIRPVSVLVRDTNLPASSSLATD